jgi:hypothetical protein
MNFGINPMFYRKEISLPFWRSWSAMDRRKSGGNNCYVHRNATKFVVRGR